MLAEIGHILLILGIASTMVASLLSGCSMLKTPVTGLSNLVPQLLSIGFSAILMATFILAACFYLDDFSVRYVAQHSNSALPIAFKIAAVWGGHEGSFLFMVLALSGWSSLVSKDKRLPADYANATRFVLSTTVLLLGIYCLWLSNPFLRQIPSPLEGRDLNPMLQDIGLILHPPLLYMGYIGFAVPFAFAIAALLTRSPAKVWVGQCRQWTLMTWAFLTVGIGIGSWWAYHELGWGGWWFWDPVENASLLPWLTATALIHCLIATERNNKLVSWSLLLAIITFALSILGTFIVRSGVLTSVHAFASDPMRGSGLLLILTILLIPSLFLFALRGAHLAKDSSVNMGGNTLALWMTISAGLLSSMMLIVMLGTFYPMVYAAMGLGTLSVGAPYFNSLFAPLAIIVAFSAAYSTVQRLSLPRQIALLLIASLIALATNYALSRFYQIPFSVLVFFAILAGFVLLISGATAITTQAKTLRTWVMVLGHTGLAVTLLGATLLSGFSNETSLKMTRGSTVVLGTYSLIHQGSSWHIGPNYTAERITMEVRKNGSVIGHVKPEKRHYTVRTMNMSEAGVLRDVLSDVYVTLGSKFDANTYAVRIQIKPFVHLLWVGGFIMMLAGFLGALRKLMPTSPAANRTNPAKQYKHYEV
ncbi:hypothetical protein RN22_20015 [Grimontia sp. AD028]|uniref:heme lyase CcmF/NrfE family subunit n=1 Tax=Grimontia sp. AD028 TaxID=1581149 RepID=UPI00061AD6B1|nr:heme lyase CcmF/NrfE family subunit [Grimontia sp. AD028]KKD58651.1 hypothetical protein RN22_20015 [Grimontia sp. AD028]